MLPQPPANVSRVFVRQGYPIPFRPSHGCTVAYKGFGNVAFFAGQRAGLSAGVAVLQVKFPHGHRPFRLPLD
jgi:hypothetical protein